jgi:cell division protein WhiA
MSFGEAVRAEMSESLPAAPHCRLALLSGVLRAAGRLHLHGRGELHVDCDLASAAVARHLVTLLRAGGATCEIRTYHERRFGKRARYQVIVGSDARSLQVLEEAGVLGSSLAPSERVPRRVVARSCCRRTFLRGAFIASGSLTDPRAGAHLELRSASPESAQELAELAAEEGFPLAVHVGGRHAIAYAKRGETIRDLLVALGAHGSELRLEEAAVLAETRAQANRLANADAGNLRRHARAAEEQLAAIEHLGGLDALTTPLRTVAELRVVYPEASLSELADLSHPPLTRAAIAGRLRRIVERADQNG